MLKKAAESKAPPMHPDYPTLTYFAGLIQKLATCSIPTIALVESRARAGGLDIAIACDMRYGIKGSTLLSPIEARASTIGGSGPPLINLMGRGRAMEWIYSGHDMDAETADKYGVLNRCFDSSEEARKYIDEYCATLNKLPGHHIREMKKMWVEPLFPVSALEDATNKFVAVLQHPKTAEILQKVLTMLTPDAELDLPKNLMKMYE